MTLLSGTTLESAIHPRGVYDQDLGGFYSQNRMMSMSYYSSLHRYLNTQIRGQAIVD